MNILARIRNIRKSLLFENNEIPASARKRKSPSKPRKTADRSHLVKKQITRKDGRIMNYWVNPNKDKQTIKTPKQSNQVVTPDLFTAAAERIKEVAAAVNKIKAAGYEIGQEVSHTLQNGKVLKGKVAIKDRQAAIELDKPHNDQTHSQFNNKWEKTETETKKKTENNKVTIIGNNRDMLNFGYISYKVKTENGLEFDVPVKGIKGVKLNKYKVTLNKKEIGSTVKLNETGMSYKQAAEDKKIENKKIVERLKQEEIEWKTDRPKKEAELREKAEAEKIERAERKLERTKKILDDYNFPLGRKVSFVLKDGTELTGTVAIYKNLAAIELNTPYKGIEYSALNEKWKLENKEEGVENPSVEDVELYLGAPTILKDVTFGQSESNKKQKTTKEIEYPNTILSLDGEEFKSSKLTNHPMLDYKGYWIKDKEEYSNFLHKDYVKGEKLTNKGLEEFNRKKNKYKKLFGEKTPKKEDRKKATEESDLKVGQIKTENGKIYRLNKNHRWELVEEDEEKKETHKTEEQELIESLGLDPNENQFIKTDKKGHHIKNKDGRLMIVSKNYKGKTHKTEEQAQTEDKRKDPNIILGRDGEELEIIRGSTIEFRYGKNVHIKDKDGFSVSFLEPKDIKDGKLTEQAIEEFERARKLSKKIENPEEEQQNQEAEKQAKIKDAEILRSLGLSTTKNKILATDENSYFVEQENMDEMRVFKEGKEPRIRDFKVRIEKHKALLLKDEQDREFWIQRRWIRKNGTLTEKGLEAQAKGKTKEKSKEQNKEYSEELFYFNPTRETEKGVAFLWEFQSTSSHFPDATRNWEVWFPKSQLTKSKQDGGSWGIPRWLIIIKNEEAESALFRRYSKGNFANTFWENISLGRALYKSPEAEERGIEAADKVREALINIEERIIANKQKEKTKDIIKSLKRASIALQKQNPYKFKFITLAKTYQKTKAKQDA